MSKHKFFTEGSLSRKINLSQCTGQGRILAPFLYKVYVNGLLKVLSDHCNAIFINGLRITSPSFADDMSLLTLHPSFLKTFMNICNRYGIKWRYDFNNSKSGIVTFGETMDDLRMDRKQYASKVRNKALEDFDWLSQWLE